jgi:dolichyl-phosphate-mannose-protein mannosyltransferase
VPVATSHVPDSTATRWRIARTLSVLALFVATSVLTRIIVLGVPVLNIDETSYIVGARELLRGKLLYTDFADNKPPLIYAYYALIQLLGGDSMLGVRLLTHIVTVPLTALAASAFYRHDRHGIVAGLVYLVYSAAYLGHDMLAVNCELVMLLPLAWAIVYIRHSDDALCPSRVFAAGLLIGLGMLIKYQAALWLPAAALAIGVECRPRNRRGVAASLGMLAAGFTLPLLTTSAIFSSVGGLKGFFYWNVTHNLRYMANPTTVPQILWRTTTRLLPFLVATAALWFACLRSIAPAPSRYRAHLISGLIVASLLASFLGFRLFPHYFVQLYLPLAIGAAPWMADLVEWPLASIGWIVTSYSALVLAGFTIANGVLHLRPNVIYEEANPVFSRVADRLRADRCYGRGTLFVWGYAAPLFYYYSGLPPASRFFFPEFPLVDYVPGNRVASRGHLRPQVRGRAQGWKQLLADLRRNQPTYILDTAPGGLFDWQYFPLRDYPQLETFARTEYESVGSIGGVEIYRRRRCER